MPDPRQIPYLLRLLEDESPEVRDAVMSEFEAFGPLLEDHLLELDLPGHHRRLIDGLIRLGRRKRLREEWPSLGTVVDDKELLESGLGLLAEFLQHPRATESLTALLDALADGFNGGPYQQDTLALAEFLFQTKGLAGARDSYYNPQSSNLVHVITRRRGLPISLACVYILVAYRCGLIVEGCNLPGHFLALASHGGRRFVIDCFNGGVVLLDTDLARLSSSAPVSTSDLAALECDAPIIITRVLRNLMNAFRRMEDDAAAQDAALIEELLQGFSSRGS